MGKIEHDHQTPEEWRSGVVTRMRVSALTGSRDLCIFEQWCAPGTGAPLHRHPVEEVLTVLAGRMEVHLMGGRAILSANESVVVPAEAIHGFTNLDDTELHLLAVLASASFEAVPESTGVPVRHWSSHND